MLLHTAGRFRNEMQQQQASRGARTDICLHVKDVDISPTVFHAIVDYIDSGNGAGSIRHSNDEADVDQACCALIQGAAFLTMEVFLDVLARHMRWSQMSVPKICTLLGACLRFWPRAEFLRPACKALASPHCVRAVCTTDAWRALVPLADHLLDLWPRPACDYLDLDGDCVARMAAGDTPPHERVMLFFILFAMLCRDAGPLPDASEVTPAPGLPELFHQVADLVCPFSCPAVAQMCDFALDCAAAGCTGAAAALRVLHSHFVTSGPAPSFTAPAQVVPLWAGHAAAEWGDIPANCALGIHTAEHTVRLLVRFRADELAAQASSSSNSLDHDAEFAVTSSVMAFAHAHGVHDFALELRKEKGADFDRARLVLHRRCHEQRSGVAVCFQVQFAVLSWRKCGLRLAEHLTRGHLSAIEGAHFEEYGLITERDAPGVRGAWVLSDGSNILWDHLCQSHAEPGSGSLVCCVDLCCKDVEEKSPRAGQRKA